MKVSNNDFVASFGFDLIGVVDDIFFFHVSLGCYMYRLCSHLF
jgi:hypothetical protein